MSIIDMTINDKFYEGRERWRQNLFNVKPIEIKFDIGSDKVNSVLEKKEEKVVSTKIEWKGGEGKYFKDLAVGEHFVVDTDQSKGAVYRKVMVQHAVVDSIYNGGDKCGSLEVATSRVFPPTQSPVRVVEVTISVSAVKPNLPGY